MLTKISSTLWADLSKTIRVEVVRDREDVWIVEIETEDVDYQSDEYVSKSKAIEFAQEVVKSINSQS